MRGTAVIKPSMRCRQHPPDRGTPREDNIYSNITHGKSSGKHKKQKKKKKNHKVWSHISGHWRGILSLHPESKRPT